MSSTLQTVIVNNKSENDMILFFNLRQQLDQGVQDIYQHSSSHDWLIRQKIRKFPKPNPNYFSS